MTTWARNTLGITAAALLLLTQIAPAFAQDDCKAARRWITCEDRKPPDDGDDNDKPRVRYTMHWGAWEPSRTECEPGRPAFIRGLYWNAGEFAGSPVHISDFTYVFGPMERVPEAPPRLDGSPAVFDADWLVYDRACIADPGPDMELRVFALVPEFEMGHNPYVRGLVNLETWLWYPGPTTIEPFSDTWTDPVTGLDFTLEARGYIESYHWDLGDGTTYETNEPGSDDNLPGTEAVEHIWTRTGTLSVGAETIWRGEYRTETPGVGWSEWVLMPGTASASDTWGPFDVIAIRSDLYNRDG